MRAIIAFACAAMLSALCLVASVDGASAGDGSAVRLPGAIEFMNPDPKSWEWTSGARCLMYSPRAVALLIDAKRDAVIRFHLFDAGENPPGGVAAAYIDVLKRDGWSYARVRDGGKTGESVVAFRSPDRAISGKLAVRILPGNPKLTALVIGLWREQDSAAVIKDFDAAARSVKWCPPNQ